MLVTNLIRQYRRLRDLCLYEVQVVLRQVGVAAQVERLELREIADLERKAR